MKLFSNLTIATSVMDSTLFKGIQKLLNDLSSALLIIAPIVGTVLVVYFLIRKGAAASDEHDQKRWDNAIKTAIISVIGVVTASVLINVLVGYFQ